MRRITLLSIAGLTLALASCRASMPTVPSAELHSMRPLTEQPPSTAPLSSTSASPSQRRSQAFDYVDPYAPTAQTSRGNRWRKGQALRQGYIAVAQLQDFERTGGNDPDVSGEGGSIDQYPVIGGGAQWKMGGERIDIGIEALLALGGRANGGAFIVGGGGAAIAVSLDLLIVDIYGGPFVSVPLGERARLYGSIGPLIQFSSYHQSGTYLTPPQSGSGFGVGGYARTGVEFEMSPGSYVGIGVRWYDSKIDLSGGLGNVDLQAVETMLTFGLLY